MKKRSSRREEREAAQGWSRLGLASGLVLALAAAPASAGELRLVLDGEAAVTSDGNYAQSAALEGDDEQNTVGRAGFDLRLSYDLERSGLAMVYSPSWETVIEGNDDDRGLDDLDDGIAHRLLFGYRGALTRRLTLSVQERLFSSPNLDLYLPPTSPDTLAVTRRGDQLTHNLDVSVQHAVTRRGFVTLGLNHSLRTFENTALFDTETLGAQLGASFQLSDAQSIGASAGLGVFEYEDGREDDVRLLGVNYSFGFGRDTRVDLDAGLFSVDSSRLEPLVPEPTEPTEPGTELPPGTLPPTFEVREEETGWRGGIQLNQQRELFSWNVGYRHDLTAGYGLGRAAEADNAFAGISTSIGRALTLGLDGSVSRQRELVEGPGFEGDDPLSEFATGTARFSWNILPALRLTGGYSHIWQEARVEPFEDLSYSRYFLGLAFRIFSTGDTPKDPIRAGESDGREEEEKSGEDKDEEPDAP